MTSLNKDVEGNGEIWSKQWYGSKEGIWNPRFLSELNKTLQKVDSKLRFKENIKSKYNLIVKVVWMYPGWDAGVMKQPAKITTKLLFVNSEDNKILTEIDAKDALSGNWSTVFNDEGRLGECFEKTGKNFAKMIYNKLR